MTTGTPVDDLPDWPAKFAAKTAEIRARRERTAELRRQLAAARSAGKAARHRARLDRLAPHYRASQPAGDTPPHHPLTTDPATAGGNAPTRRSTTP